MAEDFHAKAFDEGTITKLQIFELYAREWLPVFLASGRPIKQEVHVFDFFSGPGTDARGELGSPLRLLRQLADFQHLPGWSKVAVHAHFFDANRSKISQLRRTIDQSGLCPASVSLDVQALEFHESLAKCDATLANAQAAKLLFIDQCGVDQVTPEVFHRMVNSPICDFLFFLSSSTLHRFRDHPAIKQKITRPDDYYQVHRAALEYYRGLLPNPAMFFLAPFSIKKGANIYGVIFGSAHPRGLDKFLQVVWKKDEINGEADFDIGRDNMRPGELFLPFDDFRPTKVRAFERELEQQLRAGHVHDEADIMRLCFDHGVKRQHAEPVLAKLKKERVIATDFRVPQVDRWGSPRLIRLLG